MEYVFTEGTGVPYDVMYDTVHAIPATPVSVAQSESSGVGSANNARRLVRTSDGTLYLVYFKQLAGIAQVYVIKSVDDGATWTDDTRISTYADMEDYANSTPAIAVDSNDCLHVVWIGEADGFTTGLQIWYAKYDGSWSYPVRISTYANMAGGPQNLPAITVDSQDYVHIVWHGRATGYTMYQIWYNVYTDAWAGPVRISTYASMSGGSNYQYNPSIAVDSEDRLHVVWHGKATGYTTHWQIWYATAVSPYAAGNWVTPVRISTYANMATNFQYTPCIAVDSDDSLHVIWNGLATGYTTHYQIWYATAVSPYAAANWVAPVRISTYDNMATNSQIQPSIAVDSNDYLHVLWHGKATGYTTQNVVWYATYVLAWATPVCIQPTGRNQYPNLRWSRWPR